MILPQQVRLLKEAVPFAVVGSTTVLDVGGKKVRGRQYPWGVIEVENPNHCDFIKLRCLLGLVSPFSSTSLPSIHIVSF